MTAAIGTAVGLLVVSQVSVIAGVGGWMPLAAPALWALDFGATWGQAALAVPFAAVWVLATLVGWHRLQLMR